MPQNEWIDRCTMELGRLCDPRRVQPWQLADLAAELWQSQGHLPPEEVARTEFDEWPPYDDYSRVPGAATMILGLDFDGVLHPLNYAAAGRFCRLPLLEAWLREHNGVDVVITSSWRDANSLDELRSHFAEDVRQRVVGVTPLAHRLFGPVWSRSAAERAKARYVRQAELEAWLREAGRDSESWFALDDDPALFEPECPNLVVCESDVGLTAERLEALGNLALPALIAQAHARFEQEVVSGKRDPRSLAVIPPSMIEGATFHVDHDAFGGPSSWDDDDPLTSKN